MTKNDRRHRAQRSRRRITVDGSFKKTSPLDVDKHWPFSVEVRPTLVDFCQLGPSVGIGQFWSNFALVWPNGQCLAQLVKLWSNLGRILEVLDEHRCNRQCCMPRGRVWASNGASADFRPNPSSARQVPAEFWKAHLRTSGPFFRSPVTDPQSKFPTLGAIVRQLLGPVAVARTQCCDHGTCLSLRNSGGARVSPRSPSERHPGPTPRLSLPLSAFRALLAL